MSRDRKTEILDTAATLFASSGLRTSLKEIADACGILPGSLYHHFESKEALIAELVGRYQGELDELAATARRDLADIDGVAFPDPIVALGERIAGCAVRNRAALLLTLYDPPSSSSIEAAMRATLEVGRDAGYIRPQVDLTLLANRLCQTLLHVSLGVFSNVRGGDQVPAIRCRALLEGIVMSEVDDNALDRSRAFAAAAETVDSWDKVDEEEDERLPLLRRVARTEFGRRGYEATTVRDIAAASGLSVGSVYRLVGSKDELLGSIMRSFVNTARAGWAGVLATDSTVVEKLDALMWLNINAVVRFSDEYNIQLAWLRESPPDSANLGVSFSARLNDLKSLLAQGARSGALYVEGPTADVRAWSLFELLWLPEDFVRKVGARPGLAFARDTLLRGVAL